MLFSLMSNLVFGAPEGSEGAILPRPLGPTDTYSVFECHDTQQGYPMLCIKQPHKFLSNSVICFWVRWLGLSCFGQRWELPIGTIKCAS